MTKAAQEFYKAEELRCIKEIAYKRLMDLWDVNSSSLVNEKMKNCEKELDEIHEKLKGFLGHGEILSHLIRIDDVNRDRSAAEAEVHFIQGFIEAYHYFRLFGTQKLIKGLEE